MHVLHVKRSATVQVDALHSAKHVFRQRFTRFRAIYW